MRTEEIEILTEKIIALAHVWGDGATINDASVGRRATITEQILNDAEIFGRPGDIRLPQRRRRLSPSWQCRLGFASAMPSGGYDAKLLGDRRPGGARQT